VIDHRRVQGKAKKERARARVVAHETHVPADRNAVHAAMHELIVDELDLYGFGNKARFVPATQKIADGLPPAIAVIERPIVHVHAHERVSAIPLQAARILHGVVESASAVL
jgi:hypothetical protein